MIVDPSQFPKFEDCFMPILNTYKKYWDLTRHELRQKVYEDYFKDYSLEPLAGKSKSPLLFSRIHRWNYYLFAGNFVERVKRWKYKISKKWENWLKSWKTLKYEYLKTHDMDFMTSTFHNGQKEDGWTWGSINTEEMSPEDMFKYASEQIEKPKKEELLEKLVEIDPFIFEKIVWTLCEKMWYWKCTVTQKSNDEWIDWILTWDSLWFDKIYIQAKRYWKDNKVNWKAIADFVWALWTKWVKRWIFFTTSIFSDHARKNADDAMKSWHSIILIDWQKLVDLMFQYNVWVQTRDVYEIKEIDWEFFEWFN